MSAALDAAKLTPAVCEVWVMASYATEGAAAAIALAAVRLGLDARNPEHWHRAELALICATSVTR